MPNSKPRLIGFIVILLTAWLGVLVGLLPLFNMLLLSLFAGGLFCLTRPLNNKLAKIVLWFVTLVTGLLAAIYRPEGFSYPIVINAEVLHPDGAPFTYAANLSKAIGGLLVLFLFAGMAYGWFISIPDVTLSPVPHILVSI